MAMLPDAARRFLDRYDAAEKARAEMADVIDECYEFALPLRNRMNASGEASRTARLFDTTAITALQDFASQVLDDLWPTDARPFDLVPGREVPADRAEDVRRVLSEVADEIIDAVNNSDFRAAAHEMFLDYGIGQGVMLIEAGDGPDELRHTCVPLTEAVLAVGPHGGIDGLYRKRAPKLRHVATMWPEAALPEVLRQRIAREPDTLAEIIEGSERDWTARGAETWRFTVIMRRPEECVLVTSEARGSGSCPFIAPSFARVTGEVIGRGPVQNARPDILTLNLLKQYNLEALGLRAIGAWQAEEDGVINVDTITIAPHTIIPIAPKSGGIRPIEMPDDPRAADLVVKDLQATIREALFVNDLGPLAQTPRSATEIMQRTADRAKRLAGPRGRLLTEALFPYIRRVAWLRRERRGLRLPPFDGKAIRIVPTGPLSRAQAQQDVLQIVQFSELVNQFEGPQQAALLVDGQKRTALLAEKIGVPPMLLRPEAERAALAQSIAALAAQGSMMGGGA